MAIEQSSNVPGVSFVFMKKGEYCWEDDQTITNGVIQVALDGGENKPEYKL